MRRKKIVPGFQLRLVLTFVGLCVLCLAAQGILVAERLTKLSERLPAGGEYLIDEVPYLLQEVMLVSFVILLPAVFLIGVFSTFRVAGPVHRFKLYLAQVARGEDVGPCRIRKEDQLHDLCELINQALEATRLKALGSETEDSDESSRAA